MKSLSEVIAEKVLSTNSGRNARNRAIFVLLRSEIQDAIDKGYPVLTVWKILYDDGQVPFGYQAFRRYAKRMIELNKTAD
jgi:hypothetical protein